MIQPSPPESLVAAAGAAGMLELGLAPIDEDEDEDDDSYASTDE